MKNRSLQIAVNHLQQARAELESCVSNLYNKLEAVTDNNVNTQIHEALTHLQMQDIIRQRLEKVEAFLKRIDNTITIDEDDHSLEEFAWKKEVDQADIDSMFHDQ